MKTKIAKSASKQAQPFRFQYKARTVTRRGKAWCVGRHCFLDKAKAFEYVDYVF